jgi:serine phosphatase RsbU (regulator of sigma subunit)
MSGDGSGPQRPVEIDHAALFTKLPTSYLVLTPDLRIADANETYLASVGRTLEEIVGRDVFEMFPATPDSLDADGRPRIKVSFEKAIASGRPDTMPVQKYDVPDAVHGGYMERWWSLIHVPVLDEQGRTVLLLQRAEDVTEYVRERQAEQASGREWRERAESVEADLYARQQELEAALAAKDLASTRLARLAEAALRLAATTTVQELTEVIISAGLAALGADGGAVGVRDPDGDTLHLALTDSLGEQNQRDFAVLPLESSLPACRAALTGETVLLPDREAGLAYSPDMASVYAATGRSAWVALPLRTDDSLLGSLTASWTAPQRFLADEVELMVAFAAQCAQALDRVRAREAEERAAAARKRLSETLQRSLLTEPPEPDHLQIAVRYQPAAAEAQVGGDWYDAFLVPDGTTTLVVGDVTGHDRNAAATMGQMRNVLRGVAQSVVEPPAAVLSALDTALRNLAVEALATAVLVQVRQDETEQATGQRRLLWSNAGHPPPLLLEPDGRATLLSRPPDLLLGLQPDTPRQDHTVLLEAGATVVLYTDGLVERRGEPLDDGLERLRKAAETHAALPVEELCDALLAELAGTPEDDVALLVLRVFPQDQPRPPEAGPRVMPDDLSSRL